MPNADFWRRAGVRACVAFCTSFCFCLPLFAWWLA
jgi:hypothetical protein